MIKINPEFKEGAIAALKINIPMIAGCPLVKNLWELSQEAPCLWFKLNDKTLDYYQVEYDAGNMTKFNLKATQEYVNDKELLKYLQTHCKAIGFNEFIQAVPMIKQQSTGVYFMGFGSYKPIYFLLKND